MRLRMNKFYGLLLMVVSVLATIVLGSINIVSVKAAGEENQTENEIEATVDIAPGTYDEYTNSDYLLGDNFKTIQDYTYGNNYIDGIVYNDDIVKIVPIELFRTYGTYTYVGKEYGFYICTMPTLHATTQADVVIFDIGYTEGNPINGGEQVEIKTSVTYQLSLLCKRKHDGVGNQ